MITFVVDGVKMKEFEIFKNQSIETKLNFLIKMAWEILQRRIEQKFVIINKEASLQLQYANILQSLIDVCQFSDGEIIKVVLEKTVFIQNQKPQEVDIIVETFINNDPYKIAIEMKCYRTKTSSGRARGAQDIFLKDVYEDIEVLENYRRTNTDIKKTYFLLMTDYKNFVFPKDKQAKCWDYDISDGFELKGPKCFTTPIGGKDINISINNSYSFDWTSVAFEEGEYYFLCLE